MVVSTRRSNTDGKDHSYTVGDKVEVVRDGVNIDIGKLLYKTKDPSGRDSPTSTMMARWMVSIEGSASEEDISEGMFGRVLMDGTEQHSISSEGSTVSTGNIATTTPTSIANISTNTNTKKAVALKVPPEDRKQGTDSTGNVATNNANTKKAVAIKVPPADRKHHHHSTRRNQVPSPAQTPNAKRAPRTRSSGADPAELLGGIEEVLLPPTKKSSGRKCGSPRLQKGETVVTVQLLTGTLYLFRGKGRRAEFVRTK